MSTIACNVSTSVPWKKYEKTKDVSTVSVWERNIPFDNSTFFSWQLTNILNVHTCANWNVTASFDFGNFILFEEQKKFDINTKIPWVPINSKDINFNLPWDPTETLDFLKRLLYTKTADCDKKNIIIWGKTKDIDIRNIIPWEKTLQVDIPDITPWRRTLPLDTVTLSTFTQGVGVEKRKILTTFFLLRWLASKGILILNHTINLTRVSDSHPIKISGGSLSIDIDSWVWQFSANVLNKESLDLVDPMKQGGPVEVLLTINGYTWKFVVTKVSDRYEYGNSQYSISGYSTAITLGEPYSPKITKTWTELTSAYALVANLLAEKGWGVDWNLIDWDIQANTFSVTDMTISQIVAVVAKAVGGIFRTHPYEKELQFLYRFPVSPKDWGSTEPKEFLLTGIILGQSNESETHPNYNYVVVSGKDYGCLVHVKRSGTSYDIPAPHVVDPLIQTQQVGMQRGRNILDEEGYDRCIVTLDLPLPHASSNDRPKLLFPGDLVQVYDLNEVWKAAVLSTAILFNLNSVTMTVKLDRVIQS